MALGTYWVLESRVDNSKGEFVLVYSHRHDFDLCAIAYYDKHRRLIQTHHGTSETVALFTDAWKRGEPLG